MYNNLTETTPIIFAAMSWNKDPRQMTDDELDRFIRLLQIQQEQQNARHNRIEGRVQEHTLQVEKIRHNLESLKSLLAAKRRGESGGDEGIRGNGNDSNGGGCRVFKDQHFRTDDDIGGAGGSSIAGI